MRKYHLLGAVAFACLSLGTIVACDNNPFSPKAEPRIIDVKSSEAGKFVGIRQSLSSQNGNKFILYTYSEPVVTIDQEPGYPLVNFKRFSARITLADGTILPTKEFPLSKGMPAVANAPGVVAAAPTTLELQFPIMGVDSDLQNVVYAGNNAPRVRDGVADVTVYGTDLNSNNIEISFSVPLRFESLIFSESVVPPALGPSVSPSAPSSPNSGGN